MALSISKFMQKLADAFFHGDHEWLANIYAYPLAVYLDGGIIIENTPQDAMDSLFSRRAAVLAAGTKKIRATVLNSEEGTSGRFPVRVKWDFLDARGKTIATNHIRYFCRFTPDGEPKIEILEFISRGIASQGAKPEDPSAIH